MGNTFRDEPDFESTAGLGNTAALDLLFVSVCLALVVLHLWAVGFFRRVKRRLEGLDPDIPERPIVPEIPETEWVPPGFRTWEVPDLDRPGRMKK